MNNKIKKLIISSLIGMLFFSTTFPSFAGEYGSWKKLSGLSGVQFRTKCNENYNPDIWSAELYNGYNKRIRMEVILTQTNVNSYPKNQTHNSFSILPGNTTTTIGGDWKPCSGKSGVKIWYRNVKFY